MSIDYYSANFQTNFKAIRYARLMRQAVSETESEAESWFP